ncbi:MAG: hypothetical protein ACPG6P_07990 [Akkermansiaceae bacterium]
MTNRKKTQATLLVLALLVVLLLIFKSGIARGLSTSEGDDHTRRGASRSVGDNKKEARAARKSKAQSLSDIDPTHDYADLKNFHLRPVKLREERFTQAVSTLLANYREACTKTGEQPVRFRLRYDDSVKDQPMRLNLPNGSFDMQLRLLCAAAGVKVEHEGGNLTFRSIASTLGENFDADELFTRAFSPVPALRSRLARLTGYEAVRSDPFAAELEEVHPAGNTHELLNKFAQKDSEVVNVFSNYIPATEAIVVRNTMTELYRIEALLGVMRDYPVRNIATRNQLITFPSDFEVDRENFPNLAQLAAVPGVEIKTLPSVIHKLGERYKVESVSHQMASDQAHQNWSGIKYGGQTSRLGFGLEYQNDVETGQAPAQGGDSYDYQKKSMKGIGTPGEKLITKLPNKNGNQQYMVITSQMVDDSGSVVKEKPRSAP